MPVETRKRDYADQYFTGTQASLFVGDIWIDEVTNIQFHATQSILPIYGYASAFWDAVARGKVLVQGIFEINFIDNGYLYAVLSETHRQRVDVLDKRRSPADIVVEQLELLKDVNADRPTPVVDGRNGETTDVQEISRRDTFASVLQQLANMEIQEADKVASKLVEARATNPNNNIIYRMIPFRLTGYFGHPEVQGGKEQGTFKELNDCFLVSNEMIIGSNDEVVGERYSFICRMHE